MPRRPPSAELNKISVFIVYLHDSAVICRQHICLIVNKSRKHVNSSILIICHMNFALSLGSLSWNLFTGQYQPIIILRPRKLFNAFNYITTIHWGGPVSKMAEAKFLAPLNI